MPLSPIRAGRLSTGFERSPITSVPPVRLAPALRRLCQKYDHCLVDGRRLEQTIDAATGAAQLDLQRSWGRGASPSCPAPLNCWSSSLRPLPKAGFEQSHRLCWNLQPVLADPGSGAGAAGSRRNTQVNGPPGVEPSPTTSTIQGAGRPARRDSQATAARGVWVRPQWTSHPHHATMRRGRCSWGIVAEWRMAARWLDLRGSGTSRPRGRVAQCSPSVRTESAL